MKKTRAVAAAFMGIALTAGVAFAANPHRDARPVAQVQDDPAEQPEVEAPDTDTPETDGDSQGENGAGAQGEHGALVSKVAQDKTAVGGPNNNHGGAVSLVARGTHGAAAATRGKSKNHRPG